MLSIERRRMLVFVAIGVFIAIARTGSTMAAAVPSCTGRQANSALYYRSTPPTRSLSPVRLFEQPFILMFI